MPKRFPKRPISHRLEAASVQFLKSCLPEGWYAESVEHDYGIDLRVTIVDAGQVAGLDFLIQLKASDSATPKDYETLRLKTSTYNLLWESLPVVVLVKYVATAAEGYWILLRDMPEPSQEFETFTVRIPRENRLSVIDWTELRNYVALIKAAKLKAGRQVRERIPRPRIGHA